MFPWSSKKSAAPLDESGRGQFKLVYLAYLLLLIIVALLLVAALAPAGAMNI